MVLGIDEYLEGEERNSNINYIEFKKYYQRILKATGCEYKEWIEKINESKSEEHNIYIFGHSLAITDKDILKELITNSKVKTTIYYKDNKRYGQQIANLVKVLGQDELISMVYGSNPKIKFVLQKPMLDKQNSEWQILNDRYTLWNLYKLSDSEIRDIVNRIKENIKNNNLLYFNNQKNVISLYDALLNNCKWNAKNKLLEIAKSLYDAKTCEQYNKNDWNDIDYSGEIPCNISVCEFIDEINNFNMKSKENKIK